MRGLELALYKVACAFTRLGNMHDASLDIHSELRAAVANSRNYVVVGGDSTLEENEADNTQRPNAEAPASSSESGAD